MEGGGEDEKEGGAGGGGGGGGGGGDDQGREKRQLKSWQGVTCVMFKCSARGIVSIFF